jgi:hypothetical protein
MPREFGKSENWDYLWSKSKRNTKNINKIDEEIHDQKLVNLGNFEKDAEYLKRGQSLKIRNLRKCYSNGTVAVH